MQNRSMRLRALFFIVLGLGTTGLTLGTWGFGFLDQFERQTIDERFSIRGNEQAPSNIVVVKVDDVTFDELQKQWPFPRSLHAKVLDRIRAGHPRAVGVDVQFTAPSTPSEDNALIQAVARLHGKIVLSTTEVGPHGETGIFGGGDILRQIGARAGNGNFHQDPDGVIRKVEYENQDLKSLSIVTAEIALGHPISRSKLPGGRAWIDFVGPPGTIRSVSYSRVLNGKVPPSTFRNAIVVIGATAPVLQDIHDTAVGTGMPGPELQANAVRTALKGFPLGSAPQALNIFLIVLLGLIAPVVGLRGGPIVGTGVALAVAGLFAIATQLAFDHGWIVSFVYPLTALVLSTFGAIVVHYLVTAVEKERVRDLFSRFVPEAVVDDVLAQTGRDLRLGGKKQTATVLFSDLRGFTSSAEEMDAADVITVLNHYLGDMSDAILDHGGTLMSFMGDGIYAVWGAPIEQDDHADRALAAAREMLEVRLPRFNAWTRDNSFGKGFQMGIGLNSGPVMSGNVGHERRVEYTAVGDTVNTASRIEGMTKGTPFALFVAESTYTALKSPPDDLVYVDELEVRGRQQKLKVWGLEPEAEAAPAPQPEAEPVEAPLQVEPA